MLDIEYGSHYNQINFYRMIRLLWILSQLLPTSEQISLVFHVNPDLILNVSISQRKCCFVCVVVLFLKAFINDYCLFQILNEYISSVKNNSART